MRATRRLKLHRSRPVIVFAVLLMSAHSVQSHHASLPEGVTPLEATWLWGHYVVPDTITKDGAPYVYAYPHKDSDRIVDPPWTEVAARHIKAGAKAPAALVLHGCSGLVRGGLGYRILLMSRGYAVFEPDAFARPGYACQKSSLSMRRDELTYALGQMKKLPWVDSNRIILMGNSQGGRTVAQWNEPGFAAHIIVAASCDASGNGARRLPRAPENVPVLSVIGSRDDYFANASCRINRKIGGSKSIVIADAGHDIMGHPTLKQALHDFLNACCR